MGHGEMGRAKTSGKATLGLALVLSVGCGTSGTTAPSGARPDAEVETAVDATTTDGPSADGPSADETSAHVADATGVTDALATSAADAACFPPGTAPNAGAPVGAPCVQGTEADPQFAGAQASELSLDRVNSGCATGACIANHFQGRVTCPYGQSASGEGPAGTAGCEAPGTCDPVTVQVSPQCADRTAAEAVYCSCRCANAAGQTDDGATYCTCPGSMTCALVFESFGKPDSGSYLAGGTYCMKAGTGYEAGVPACAACDPTASPCP